MFITIKRILTVTLIVLTILLISEKFLSSSYYKAQNYEVNNYGPNLNLILQKDRQKNVNEKDLKIILAWNEAYGSKKYDIGFGREPFYKYKCPETRCYMTDQRDYKNVEDFDAIIFHQRSFKWSDIPKKRKNHQRYIHWLVESAQYIYMDISTMNGFFNWTMTYRSDSDFYLPYGRIVKVKEHTSDPIELKQLIEKFGKKNKYIAKRKNEPQAAWFVSHCATMARRELYAKALGRSYPLHIYGKCGKYKCDRGNETFCYQMLEENYKYYLSFENSICKDYVTEKFFTILKKNIIPITLSGADYKSIAPPHSYISVYDHANPKKVAKYLQYLDDNDEKYAEFFWWKDYYEIRNQAEDRAQSYCKLCEDLWNSPPKVYDNIENWWVRQSFCKKITLNYP
ncbi:alpha-(1,3)-fucosyltransferase C [Lepeophtheirus salmonis]|uniref:alpha-(1,3)-fucosyltransferase C n=1 Tax=Lepeophtheirus salmonis TaxID=72036 RepID=UPI001AE47DD0|nr:alpha-(1,3)-fucosyltransferase C-like [Lepeophtheirus salmonis]